MQGHRDKPTREELEEDQFLAWVLDAVEYVKERSQLFIGGVAAIVVAIMAITYVQASREEAKIEGSALLGRAAIADASGQFDEATRLHEQLAEEFGGTPAGAQGMVLLGNRYFAQARYADAQRLFEQYLREHGDVDVLVFAAWTGLAACLESQGETERAAEKYRGYADEYGGHLDAAISLADAARCYGVLGAAGDQRAALERIVNDYPKAPGAARAREELKML